MAEYPEHEKLKKVSDECQTIGMFLEWLREKYTICDPDYPSHKGIEDFLAEYFNIDQKILEQEKRQMLEELRNG